MQMSSDSDSDDDKYYEMKKKMVCHHAQKMSIICSGASNVVGKYCENWVIKAAPRTSILSGFGWLQETIDTPEETYTMLRMSAKVFFDLHDMLVERYGLKHSIFVSSYESLAMFLWILGVVKQIEERKTVSNIQQILSTVNFMRYSFVSSRWPLTT
jgi:hypothetical protein